MKNAEVHAICPHFTRWSLQITVNNSDEIRGARARMGEKRYAHKVSEGNP